MMKQKLAVLCAAVTAAAALPSFSVSAERVSVDSSYTLDHDDGTYIGAWHDGRGTMDVQDNPDGSCSAQWEGVHDCTLQNGIHAKDPIPVYYLSQLDVSYEAEIETADTTVWYGVNGSINLGRGKLDSFYVIEGWNGYYPCAKDQLLRTVEIGGVLYDQYRVIRSIGGIDPPPADVEYWSIRHENAYVPGQKNHCTGTIPLAEHLAAWTEGTDFVAASKYQIEYIYFEVSDWDAQLSATASCTIQKPEIRISYRDGVRSKTVQYPERDDSEPYRKHQNKDYSYVASGLDFKDILGPYFRIGAAVSEDKLRNTGWKSYRDRFNSIAGMGDFKPSATVSGVDGTEVTVRLSDTNDILRFAEYNGLALRGSAFILPGMTPDTMLHCTPETADARIESLIRNTFAAYKNIVPDARIYAYDVCSEIFKQEGGGLRTAADGNGWAEIYGDDSIQPYLTAFKAAREYAPEGCKLYLSDFYEYMPEKCEDICRFAKKIMAEGDYIDGIGMQSHLSAETFDKTAYESAMRKFIALGLDVQITELEMTDVFSQSAIKDGIPKPENPTENEEDAYWNAVFNAQEARKEEIIAKQRAGWKDVFSVAMNYADHISSVTLWDPVNNSYDTVSVSGSYYDGIIKTYLFDPSNGADPACYDILRLTEEIEPPVQTEGPILLPPQAKTVTTAEEAQIQDPVTGDANCDGSVDVADAVLVLRFISEDDTAGILDQGVQNGDVNHDGETDTEDASLILQYIARKIIF